MVPRRIKILTSSTPSVANPSATFGIASEVSDPSTISGSSFIIGKIGVKHDGVSKMSTLEWVLKAIETVGVPRKGASYVAILKWIVNNKENVVINRLKTNLKKAIEKALGNGLLKRPTVSKNVTGLRGYFIKNKDTVTGVQKIPKTKTARKLVEMTNLTKVPNAKTAVAPKTKATAQPKANTEKSIKPKQLPKSAKSDAAGPSSKPKTQPKSKAEKPKTDAEAGNSKPKTHPKAKTDKLNRDGEIGPSRKLKTQPKAKTNTDVGAVHRSRPKTQPNSKAAKPKSDADAVPNSKSKTQPKPAEPNNDVESGPSSRPKTRAAKPNADADAVPNIKRKTLPKVKAPEPNSEDGPSSKLKTPPKAKAAVKPRPGKPGLKDILPSVAKKVSKAESKISKKTQKIHPKKLYKPPGDLPLNISKEEFSDSEWNLKQQHSNVRVDNRNSNASNPESEVICNTKVAKAKKVAKNVEVKKLNKKETSEAGSSVTHAKKRKGRNTTAVD